MARSYLVVITTCMICGLSGGLSIRGTSQSQKGSSGRHDSTTGLPSVEVEDELDTLFKNDKFFSEFDRSVQERNQLTSSSSSSSSVIPTTATPTELPDSESQAKLDIQQVSVPPGETILNSTLLVSSDTTDCKMGQKTFLENANEGFMTITDTLLGVIGLSTMQTSIKPVIMILVAGVTGFFWAVVFWYLYSNFFTGGGYFGGEGGGMEGFGLFDFLKKDKFKKDKYKNKYNNYSPASAYGRKSDVDWDHYTNILTNLASYGWDKITEAYGVE